MSNTPRKAARPRKTQAANEKVPVADTVTVDEPLPKPIEKPQSLWDKFIFFLQLRDGIWSVPLWFMLYYYTGVILVWIFGFGTGAYDMAFVQPLALAGCVIVGATSITQFVIYFNYRGLQRYFYGKVKPQEGIIQNVSKKDFENLTPWQRIILCLLVFFFYTAAAVVVFLKLI